jgi:hypothetical protein
MKTRDFYTLPMGKSLLKDEIYTYEADKSLTDDGDWIIRITTKGSIFGPSIFVHPSEDFIYEESSRWRDGYFKYKTVSYGMHMGSFHVHSDNYQYSLKDIDIMPRGSFKEYVSKEINP